MKQNMTEIVFIIDKSGSMGCLRDDTIGSFNTMLEQQKAQKGEAKVTTVFFSDDKHFVHDRISLSEVKPLQRCDYKPMGCTALYDTVGSVIEHISSIHKYARPEDRPENTMFVIITDGMENASHHFSGAQVRKMVEEKKAAGWEFIFLGANIDAEETAANIGISRERAVNWSADACGSRAAFRAVSRAVGNVRACAPMCDEWREELDRDNGKKN